MHELTSSIDFCRVSQIYFPLSASFYRDRFPADDLENCRKDEDIENCRGEQDTYGNFREARIGKDWLFNFCGVDREDKLSTRVNPCG